MHVSQSEMCLHFVCGRQILTCLLSACSCHVQVASSLAGTAEMERVFMQTQEQQCLQCLMVHSYRVASIVDRFSALGNTKSAQKHAPDLLGRCVQQR